MLRQGSFIITCVIIGFVCNFWATGFISIQPGLDKQKEQLTAFDTSAKIIHVFVALCDNEYQGIVPVSKAIGNGQDANNNLYWGCGYGIRTFFKKSKEWKLLQSKKIDSLKLERLIFKHTTKNFYLVAEAYNGQYIEKCTKDFLYSCVGQLKDTLQINQTIIGIGGNANLLAYIGHNGLMDFQLTNNFKQADKKKRDCIVLACSSKFYFSEHLKPPFINPLIWTTGLMCPEAYTLHDALMGYVNNENNNQIRERAAMAYAKYQKCSKKAAINLLTTGW